MGARLTLCVACQTRAILESSARGQLVAAAGGAAHLTQAQQDKVCLTEGTLGSAGHTRFLQIDEQTAELGRYAARLEAEQRERMALEQRIKDMKARVCLTGGIVPTHVPTTSKSLITCKKQTAVKRRQ